jgi:release factor glutamine methyltransferase
LCGASNNKCNNSKDNNSTANRHVVAGVALAEWYQIAKAQARAFDVAAVELDWLLQAMSELDRLALRLGTYQNRSEIVLHCSFADLQALWQRRLRDRVPVQYLVGKTPWRQFSLRVSPGVLIPRPETEQIVEIARDAVAEYPDLGRGHWADLGTGSGAIALGLADVLPAAQIHAVDRSPEAIAIAAENAQNVPHLRDRIQFYQGSWWQPLAAFKRQIRGMVSNPPYIPTAELATLAPEVRDREPQLALDGGADGLASLRYLIATAPDYLRPGGLWLVELMAGQAPTVAALLAQQGNYQHLQIFTDLAGIERFVLAYRSRE